MANGTRMYTSRDLREMDRLAAELLGMPTILLMEHAALALCEAVTGAADTIKSQRILFVCGPGNNGGDGYGAARQMLERGLAAHVVTVGTPREGTDASTNATMAKNFGVPIHAFGDKDVDTLFQQAEIIVDCIFGTGLTRAPEGDALAAIERINAAYEGGAAVIAADVPSGLDADLGLPLGACVKAHMTVTFAGTKVGFVREKAAAAYTGAIVVMRIGMPAGLLERFGERLSTEKKKPARTASTKKAPKAKASPKKTAARRASVKRA